MRRGKAPTNLREWFDLALFYCSRRETSRPRLLAYLQRKLKSYRLSEEESDEAKRFIEKALDECERLKIIDHERYAGILTREYARRGKGKRYVTQKLQEKGLQEEISKLEINDEDEYARAVALAEKSLQRSNIKKLTDTREIKTKVLQRLVANGFDFGIAKKAIEVVIKKT